jgi:hypothetical protein
MNRWDFIKTAASVGLAWQFLLVVFPNLVVGFLKWKRVLGNGLVWRC